jgi:protein-tyrosine phosphatase
MDMTDFHSHILPGMDDGSADLETSLEMLSRAAAQGIRRVVATPHFYPRYEDPARFLHRRDRAEEALRQAMEGHPELPEVLVGAEVYYFRGISESEWLPKLTIQGTDAVLIEMPPAPWPDAVYRELADIREKRGYMPVIAHIDRYIGRFRTFGIPGKLQELPVLVQANASFFLERSTLAMKLLKADQIQLLGSDCHDLRDRAPNLGEAAKQIMKKTGPEVLSRIRAWEDTIVSNR